MYKYILLENGWNDTTIAINYATTAFIKKDIIISPIKTKFKSFSAAFHKNTVSIIKELTEDGYEYIVNDFGYIGISYDDYASENVHEEILKALFKSVTDIYSIKYIIDLNNGGGDNDYLFLLNDSTILNMYLTFDHEDGSFKFSTFSTKINTKYFWFKNKDIFSQEPQYTFKIPNDDIDLHKKIENTTVNSDELTIVNTLPLKYDMPSISNGGKVYVNYRLFFKNKLKSGLEIGINTTFKSFLNGKFSINVSKLNSTDINKLINEALVYYAHKVISINNESYGKPELKNISNFKHIITNKLFSENNIETHLLSNDKTLFKYAIVYDTKAKELYIKHITLVNNILSTENLFSANESFDGIEQMLIKSPYDTTYGKLLNSEVIIKSLIKFLASNTDINLNYEYNTANNVKLVIITGYSPDEKELPLWEHPLPLKDHRGNNVVAVDLRKYVKLADNNQPLNIKDIAKDSSNINFIVLRALLTADFVAGQFGNLRNSFKGIASGFSLIISSVLSSVISLNPIEKLNIEIASSFYVNAMFTDTDDLSELKDAFISRISNSKLSIPVNTKIVTEVINMLDINAKDIDSLISNFRLFVSEEKSKYITTNVLVSALSNIWHGPGSNETMAMALEHMPTWTAMMYVNLSDNTFKRHRLAMLLDKYKRNVDSSEIIKNIDIYLKEHKF